MALVLPVVFGCDVFDFECVLSVSARDQLVPVLVDEPVQTDEKNVLVGIADPRNLTKKSKLVNLQALLLYAVKTVSSSSYVSH